MERPQMLLPFAEREYIDVARTCRILGCSWAVISRLVEACEIDLVDFRRRGWKRVRYASIVAYCDRLRERHKIEDRRPPLENPLLRYRDADLLPFPLSDTVGAKEACMALGARKLDMMVNLLEEGAFEGYQLMALSPWRISLGSLQRYLERVLPSSPPGTAAKFTVLPRF